MSSDVEKLFNTFDQLKKLLEDAWEKLGVASAQATVIGGEFEQEISTDLDGFQVAIRMVLDDLDSVVEEAVTLQDDFEELESKLRGGLDDEENYKVDAEHIQEEMREDKP